MTDNLRRDLRYALVAAVPLVIGYGLLFVLGQQAIEDYVEEDGFVEWAGAIGLFATSFLFALTFVRARTDETVGKIMLVSLALLSLVFFVGGGEEISWGQRIFGWGTPESLGSVNAQDETNLHNLAVLNGALDVNNLFKAFWFAFGVLLPIVAALSERVRTTIGRLVPILPLWLALMLIFQQVFAELTSALDERAPSLYDGTIAFAQARTEVTEAVVSLLLALGAYSVYRQFAERSRTGVEPAATADGRELREPAA